MKRFFSSWQGLLAGIISFLLFFGSGPALRWIDPTAGTFDAGFLQWIILATVAFFWAVFCAWVGFQIAFPSTDKAADTGLEAWFWAMGPGERWKAVQWLFMGLLVLFVAILFAVPV